MFEPDRPLLGEILALHGKWKGARPAIEADGRIITWMDFARAIAQVGEGFRGAGLAAGDRVGIAASNAPEAIEVIFGAMAAGLVAVPVNIWVSDESLMLMLSDAGVRALVVTADQRGRLSPLTALIKTLVPGALICIGEDAPAFPWKCYATWRDAFAGNPDAGTVASSAPCNIIYSSGTTGIPKGITHTQTGRLDWAYDLAIALRYNSGARTLGTLGLYSNVSWIMMLCTFLCGGTFVLQAKFDPDGVLAAIERHRITHMAMVPVQYQRLLDSPRFAPATVASLQAIVSCGSPLAPKTKIRLFESLACGVTELYGLTEGIITTLDPEDAPGRLASVGRPIQGVDIRLLAADDRDVTIGEAGEIVGRCRFMMEGYWNRPEATDAATWIDEAGRTWFRTGDIGRLDEDRFLYIVDRKKDMILSGAQNIYPADIEAVLLAHGDVVECAVIGVPDTRWGETPLAVVVPGPRAPRREELLAWANRRLGKLQRLADVVYRDALPRNPNGKILKRELRALYAPE